MPRRVTSSGSDVATYLMNGRNTSMVVMFPEPARSTKPGLLIGMKVTGVLSLPPHVAVSVYP